MCSQPPKRCRRLPPRSRPTSTPSCAHGLPDAGSSGSPVARADAAGDALFEVLEPAATSPADCPPHADERPAVPEAGLPPRPLAGRISATLTWMLGIPPTRPRLSARLRRPGRGSAFDQTVRGLRTSPAAASGSRSASFSTPRRSTASCNGRSSWHGTPLFEHVALMQGLGGDDGLRPDEPGGSGSTPRTTSRSCGWRSRPWTATASTSRSTSNT